MTDFVLPNPPALLNTSWFLALILVTVAAIVAAAVSGMLVRARERGSQVEDDQTIAIQALRDEFRQCQIREAARASNYVTREQHEGRIMRIEDAIGDRLKALDKRIESGHSRLHQRIDAIALKLGVPED